MVTKPVCGRSTFRFQARKTRIMGEDFLCSALSTRRFQDRLRWDTVLPSRTFLHSRIRLPFDFTVLDAHSVVPNPAVSLHTHTHTNTHTQIYIYIYCVKVTTTKPLSVFCRILNRRPLISFVAKKPNFPYIFLI